MDLDFDAFLLDDLVTTDLTDSLDALMPLHAQLDLEADWTHEADTDSLDDESVYSDDTERVEHNDGDGMDLDDTQEFVLGEAPLVDAVMSKASNEALEELLRRNADVLQHDDAPLRVVRACHAGRSFASIEKPRLGAVTLVTSPDASALFTKASTGPGRLGHGWRSDGAQRKLKDSTLRHKYFVNTDADLQHQSLHVWWLTDMHDRFLMHMLPKDQRVSKRKFDAKDDQPALTIDPEGWFVSNPDFDLDVGFLDVLSDPLPIDNDAFDSCSSSGAKTHTPLVASPKRRRL